MNPSTAGLWNDPPPPGLEEEREPAKVISVESDKTVEHKHRDKHGYRGRRSRSRSHDRSHRSRSRSRDKSRRHRSRSRKKHRKSRSRSRGHYRHRSRSYSRSNSRERSRHRHKERKRRRSRSKSRRHSRSRSRSRRHHRSKTSRSPHSNKNDFSDKEGNRDVEEDDDVEAENKNAFKNDGSFLELYKKMQEEQQKAEAAKAETQASEIKKPIFGKRRGGRVLKTGMVAKNKQGEEGDGVEPQDPWSIYLKEVKRYKEACCDDDSKTRPLTQGSMQTAPFDPRFPNTNQTRYCYQSYLDFHRCQKVKGASYAPCNYFKKMYEALCPHAWVEKWDDQVDSGNFPGTV